MGSILGTHAINCQCPACVLRDAQRLFPNELPMMVIFERPLDFPEHVVMRIFLTDKPGTRAWTFDTIEHARAAIPDGLVRIPRDPNDHPTVVESWL